MNKAGQDPNTGTAPTQPVGQLKPNPWGLYDMGGNVWEWTLDYYAQFPRSGNPVVDPLSTKSDLQPKHALKGCGANSPPRWARSAAREYDPLDNKGVLHELDLPHTVIGTVAWVGITGAQGPVRPFQSEAEPAARGRIDELVFGKLTQLGIKPARGCSDEVFVRRVYLDVIGTLPTAAEAAQFLKDDSPNKRQALIERLLERSEFADYWAMKWCDLLLVKSEFPINLWPNAVQAYHRWIRACLKENVPYDQFARELLTASGSNFRKPQVNFYRAIQSRKPPAIAQAVALNFMGARTEKWPAERLAGMAALFSLVAYKPTMKWKEEIVLFDVEEAESEPALQTLRTAVFPDGTPAHLSPDRDPRAVFADWLIAPQNPWFARNIANRVWSWFLGRGIIHEPDDIRPDNPPSNPELLAFLEQELVAARYDLKHLYRLILNSQTYQLAHIPRSEDPNAEANFAVYPLRRLEAEVLIDALCGASDAKGEDVKDRPVYPCDLIGSIYALLGIDPDGKLANPMGLDLTLTPSAADGIPMAGRLKEIMR